MTSLSNKIFVPFIGHKNLRDGMNRTQMALHPGQVIDTTRYGDQSLVLRLFMQILLFALRNKYYSIMSRSRYQTIE